MELLSRNDNKLQRNSRRNFLVTSLLAAGAFASASKWWPRWKKKSRTVKLLTHDGKLVEVDAARMPFNRRVATKKDLVKWVWKERNFNHQS